MFKFEREMREYSVFRAFEKVSSLRNVYVSVMTPICEKYGLTYMELIILMLLHNNPTYNTATELVKLRRLTKSHVSISVRSLMNKGLLKGEQKENDRRTVHLHVTEAAEPVIADGTAAQRDFGKIMFNGFSKEELAAMCAMIERINANISTYENEGATDAKQ